MDISTLAECTRRDWESVGASSVEPVRFAVIGLGWFTRGRALPALEASDRCEPTVLVSSTSEKADRVAREFETPDHGITYDEFHEGVASDAYDAVYICTPNALHLPYAETASEFGKAVLCEKPLERSTERARELVETCADSGVALMVGYRMHTEPAVRRARELLADGYVGTPESVRGHMSQVMFDQVNPDTDQWRLDEELAGGGALFDIGIYPLNTARFLLDADPVAVTGRTQSTHEAFDEVEEAVTFTVEFPDELYASCFASHNARQSSAITVTGTEGEIRIEPAFFQNRTRELHLSRGDTRTSITIDRVDQMLEEFDYFADRLRGEESILPDGDHGVVDMQAMEAVYGSDASGGWEPIP
ncbi:MAG: glucose-fructose oxidoreductase [Halobacteriales archaeon SW_8_66_22]|nr:MAG: glucose-fructose oxidoreductase [Halobacteriales archaeon SW_8_66_22]